MTCARSAPALQCRPPHAYPSRAYPSHTESLQDRYSAGAGVPGDDENPAGRSLIGVIRIAIRSPLSKLARLGPTRIPVDGMQGMQRNKLRPAPSALVAPLTGQSRRRPGNEVGR